MSLAFFEMIKDGLFDDCVPKNQEQKSEECNFLEMYDQKLQDCLFGYTSSGFCYVIHAKENLGKVLDNKE